MYAKLNGRRLYPAVKYDVYVQQRHSDGLNLY